MYNQLNRVREDPVSISGIICDQLKKVREYPVSISGDHVLSVEQSEGGFSVHF